MHFVEDLDLERGFLVLTCPGEERKAILRDNTGSIFVQEICDIRPLEA